MEASGAIKGSNHCSVCPLFVDLHNKITTETGKKRVLRDLMHIGTDAAKREPLRLAAKHWPEFQGKQMLMSSFFVKRAAETSSLPLLHPTTVPPNGLAALATAFDALETQLPPPPILVESSASKAPQPLSSSSQANTELVDASILSVACHEPAFFETATTGVLRVPQMPTHGRSHCRNC